MARKKTTRKKAPKRARKPKVEPEVIEPEILDAEFESHESSLATYDSEATTIARVSDMPARRQGPPTVPPQEEASEGLVRHRIEASRPSYPRLDFPTRNGAGTSLLLDAPWAPGKGAATP